MQIEVFMSAINKHTRSPLYWRTFCYCGMHLGLRISETIHINLKDIDWKEKTLAMPYKQKNGTEYEVIALPGIMVDKLKNHVRTYRNEIAESGGWLFFSRKKTGRITTYGARKQFDRFRRCAGMDDTYATTKAGHEMRKFSYHSFRHYYSTLVFGKVQDGRAARILTRHKSDKAFESYIHINAQHKREIVERVFNDKPDDLAQIKSDIAELKNLLLNSSVINRTL